MPRVALIVGPAGSITSAFRALAEEAAVAAEAAGAQVVRVYSPDATWPAVQAAADGASIVVYLGHGNGWPSRYRDEPYPPTQNGFGLNPVAGVDDTARQYFGEAHVDRLRLAPSAVVVLAHLCYASGNTEPGLPEGTQDQAIARVDNFAAGFLRAGAAAVVAEAHLGPAWYVRALLEGQRSIEAIWRAAPTAHGNELGVPSVRSPGFTARLDPDTTQGGYNRSLVSAGVRADQVRAGAMGGAPGSGVWRPVVPSLVGSGITFGAPVLRATPVAGTISRLTVPLAKDLQRLVPAEAKLGVRWDPILVDQTSPPGPEPETPAPGEPPTVELVTRERLGEVVELARAGHGSRGLVVDVAYPADPGLYRLVLTLHAPGDVAYDAGTQAMLASLIVRVGGPAAVAWGAPSAMTLALGAPTRVTVRVVNAGTQRWDVDVAAPPVPAPAGRPGPLGRMNLPARLVATWVSTTALAIPEPVAVELAPAVSNPGGWQDVAVPVLAPTIPGSYLLLLDVLSPGLGPLSGRGADTAIIRVTVAGPPQADEAR